MDHITRLLDKIDLLEKELQEEKKNNFNKFVQGLNNITFKGVLISELYDFWQSNHQEKGK